jgi:hypothetical protein
MGKTRRRARGLALAQPSFGGLVAHGTKVHGNIAKRAEGLPSARFCDFFDFSGMTIRGLRRRAEFL